MSDKDTLQAAYDLLQMRGNELANLDGSWDDIINRTHHGLGLLLMRLSLRQDLTGSPALDPERSITCPQCKMTSYHPKDIDEQYCGNCHQFHADMKGGNNAADSSKAT